MSTEHFKKLHEQINITLSFRKNTKEELLKKAIAESKNADPAFHLMFQAMEKEFLAQDYGQALLLVEKALEIYPDEAHFHRERGNVLYNLKNYAAAGKAYEKAIEIDPNYHGAWNGKGNNLCGSRDYISAIKAYEKAIEIDPSYANAWNNKGNVLYIQKDYISAIKAYEKAIEIDPNYTIAWCNKGNALGSLGDHVAAMKAHEKAIEIDPNFSSAWEAKGIVLAKLGEHDAALRVYDKAIEIDPNNVSAWNNKGNLLVDLKEYDVALRVFDKAIEIDPDFHYTWNSKGNLLVALKDYAGAVKAYDKAIEIYPDYAISWMNKALMLSELKKTSDARSCAEEALRIDPRDTMIVSAYDFIRGKTGITKRTRQKKSQNIGKKGSDGIKKQEQAPETSPPSYVLGVITRIREEMHVVSDAFLNEMDNNKNRINSFVNDEKKGNVNGAWFHVLRKYNSYTPILPVDGSDRSIGGGYFLQSFGTGIVIDPGFGFIENFYKAGFTLDDIDIIIITHAHNDHNSDFESLLTLCHICNKEKEDIVKKAKEYSDTCNVNDAKSSNKYKENKKKQVKVYLNLGTFLKFSGMLNLRDASYFKKVYTLMEGYEYQLNKQTLLKALPAYHDEVITKQYAVGLLFTITADNGEERRILMPSDTGFYPPGENKDEVLVDPEQEIWKKYGIEDKTIHLLVPHLGSIKRQEFFEKPENLSKVFYQNHLGIIGTCLLILRIKPELAVLSEFGEELKSFQRDLVKFIGVIIDDLQKDAEIEKVKFLPGDIGFIYNVMDKTIYCQYFDKLFALKDIQYTYRTGTKGFIYYAPNEPDCESGDLTDTVDNWFKMRKDGKLLCHS